MHALFIIEGSSEFQKGVAIYVYYNSSTLRIIMNLILTHNIASYVHLTRPAEYIFYLKILNDMNNIITKNY